MQETHYILELIDRYLPEITNIIQDINHHPELGYKESYTSGIVNDFLRQSGYLTETNLAVTGIKAKLKEQNDQPNIALIGELDAIICRESSNADKYTGATHHCGHHLQLGIMMAVARAFKESGIGAGLNGNISFIAAPAEEYIELDYRRELRHSGKIRYFGGKQELVHCGAFDDVNAAIMVHSQSNTPYPFAGLVKAGNGFIAEKIKYTGKTAHAAANPEDGINALHAAILGINNVNALRETLRDSDHSRVHYIITKGGDAVNSIPADVRLECFVRSRTTEHIQHILSKINRAFLAGGEAVGAQTEFEGLSGYLPLVCNESVNELYAEKAARFIPKDRIVPIAHFHASTDMGDITHLMPAIHVLSGGVKGSLHAADFEVVDYQAAVAIPAKTIALTLIGLLSDEAAIMKSIIAENPPLLTKSQYLALLDSFFTYPGD
ncbi:MAG: amidohydrolase [Tannerella sp.]|jgi:amidohydrolase|nr:amidohydrolase [Tannerella sp.]